MKLSLALLALVIAVVYSSVSAYDEGDAVFVARELKRRKRRAKRAPRKQWNHKYCSKLANKEEANKFSKCVNDIFFAGHKSPQEQHYDMAPASVCASLVPDQCTSTFGCQLIGGVGEDKKCINVRSNAYCNSFDTEKECKNELEINDVRAAGDFDAGACYWNKLKTKCELRFHDCSEFGALECVKREGCMFFNNLYEGHKGDAPTSLSDSRSRCMSDPCWRLNNGRCTIQHTGGRCVWYTKSQNKKRGIDHAGCYQSPCNNRYNKDSCITQNDIPNAQYRCTWCGTVNGKKMGCQNAKDTSKAQCWNIRNKRQDAAVPDPVSDKCNRCLQTSGARSDGNCKFDGSTQSARAKKCATHCCGSMYCACSYGATGIDLTASNTGLNLFGGSGTGGDA